MLDFQIHEINEQLRDRVIDLIIKNWGSTIMVSKGRIHHMDRLPGYVAMVDNNILGLITYNIDNEECEIVSLDSFLEKQGIGGRLLEEVIKKAKDNNLKRVWLITTNDNTNAIRFYQKRGFNMVALYLNAVDKARKIKPEIPYYGFDGIRIMHEIEFEKKL